MLCRHAPMNFFLWGGSLIIFLLFLHTGKQFLHIHIEQNFHNSVIERTELSKRDFHATRHRQLTVIIIIVIIVTNQNRCDIIARIYL